MGQVHQDPMCHSESFQVLKRLGQCQHKLHSCMLGANGNQSHAGHLESSKVPKWQSQVEQESSMPVCTGPTDPTLPESHPLCLQSMNIRISLHFFQHQVREKITLLSFIILLFLQVMIYQLFLEPENYRDTDFKKNLPKLKTLSDSIFLKYIQKKGVFFFLLFLFLPPKFLYSSKYIN